MGKCIVTLVGKTDESGIREVGEITAAEGSAKESAEDVMEEERKNLKNPKCSDEGTKDRSG